MKKDIADAVGMPNDVDKENLRKVILRYERKHPGYILNTIQEAKRDFREQGGNKQKYGEVNKHAQGRILFELPEELHIQLEKTLPSLFRSKKHLRWFIKHFPELLIPEKY